MNLNPTDLKRAARSLFKSRNGKPRTNVLHPKRDWYIGVGIGAVLLIGIVVWSSFIYTTYRDGGVEVDDVTISNPTYQAAIVDQALGVFEQKSANFIMVSDLAGEVSSPQIEEEIVVPTATTTTTTTTITSEAVEQVIEPEPEQGDETDGETEQELPEEQPQEEVSVAEEEFELSQ